MVYLSYKNLKDNLVYQMTKVSVRIIVVTYKFWFDDWILILSQKKTRDWLVRNTLSQLSLCFLNKKCIVPKLLKE